MAGAGDPNSLDTTERLFADTYLVEANATKAYKASHPDCESDKAAAVGGSRFLRNPNIAAYLAARQDKIAKKLEVTAEWLAEQLVRNHERAHEGYAVVNKDGEIVDYRPDLTASNKALELLGKKLGIFIEKHEVDVKLSFASLVSAAGQKVGG